MKLAIGSDDAGFPLKEVLYRHLQDSEVDVTDCGVHSTEPVDYPDIGFRVAEAVSRREYDRAILICGTGIGMCITANKVPGIRAAVGHDPYSAERARKSNDAQILTMGSRVIGPELAKSIVDVWLQSEFADGRSTRKVGKIKEWESRHLGHGGTECEEAASQSGQGN